MFLAATLIGWTKKLQPRAKMRWDLPIRVYLWSKLLALELGRLTGDKDQSFWLTVRGVGTGTARSLTAPPSSVGDGTVTHLLIGILEPRERHFLHLEGARMHPKIFQGFYSRPRNPKTCCFTPTNNSLECTTSPEKNLNTKWRVIFRLKNTGRGLRPIADPAPWGGGTPSHIKPLFAPTPNYFRCPCNHYRWERRVFVSLSQTRSQLLIENTAAVCLRTT